MPMPRAHVQAAPSPPAVFIAQTALGRYRISHRRRRSLGSYAVPQQVGSATAAMSIMDVLSNTPMKQLFDVNAQVDVPEGSLGLPFVGETLELLLQGDSFGWVPCTMRSLHCGCRSGYPTGTRVICCAAQGAQEHGIWQSVEDQHFGQ